MRTGASVAWIVWDFKKRRVKRKARRGRRIAWGEGEVKGDIRCQTEGNIRMLVHIRPKEQRKAACHLRGHVGDRYWECLLC